MIGYASDSYIMLDDIGKELDRKIATKHWVIFLLNTVYIVLLALIGIDF